MHLSKRHVVAVVLAVAAATACKSKPPEKAEPEKAAASEHAKGLVSLTKEQLASARIATGVVEKRAQAGTLEATAQIEPAAERQARVGSRIEGRVVAVTGNPGDQVRQGQVLAVVDSPELGRAKADFFGALAKADVARDTADREKALYERKITSEREWREAEAEAVKARADKEAAENRLHALGVTDAELSLMKVAGHYDSRVSVPAPISGVLVERHVTQGQMIAPADTLFTIVDLREVWILLDVYERDLAQVRVGQPATVRVAAYPGQEFPGRVASIGAVFEPKSRAAKARVVLSNPGGTLRPGMFATVSLQGTTGEERMLVVVPSGAVQRDGETNLVFLPRGPQEFEPRKIKVGRALGEWVEVLEGVTEGETVVTTGSFFLKAEMKKSELGEQEG